MVYTFNISNLDYLIKQNSYFKIPKVYDDFELHSDYNIRISEFEVKTKLF